MPGEPARCRVGWVAIGPRPAPLDVTPGQAEDVRCTVRYVN
jgi:hypothetical protein